MDFIALIISILAFAVSVAAVWYTRRQAHSAVELAAIERARRSDEEAAAARNRVRWELREVRANLPRLYNVGTHDAHGVVVDARGDVRKFDRVGAGDSRQMPWPRMKQVKVSWHYAADKSDEPSTRIIPILV